MRVRDLGLTHAEGGSWGAGYASCVVQARMELVPQIARGEGKLSLAGDLRMANATLVWRTLRQLATEHQGGRLDFDLSGAVAVDGAIMSLLVDLRASLAARGVESGIIGGSDRFRSLVHLYRGDEPPLVTAAPSPGARAGAPGSCDGGAVRGLRQARGLPGEPRRGARAGVRVPAS